MVAVLPITAEENGDSKALFDGIFMLPEKKIKTVMVLLPVMKKWVKAGLGIMPREYANIAAVHQVLIQS